MSTYSFRFNVIENITATSQRIANSFAGATRAATTLANRINTVPNSIGQLNNRLGQLRRAQEESFNVREIRRYQREIDGATERLNRLTGAARSAGAAGGSFRLGGAIAGIGGGMAAVDAVQKSAQFTGARDAIAFASGGAANAGANLNFLDKIVDDMGLPLAESQQGFKLLAGSMMDVPGEKVQDIFSGVSKATTAMSLNADDANGVFLALSQIASKGTVSAEELRGQIGERLPGAFGIAAKAMNVTEAELGKMMQKGEVASKDFLPKFAAQLEKTFGEEAAKKATGPMAIFNRFENMMLKTRVALGNTLMPLATTLVPAATAALDRVVGWFERNKPAITAFGTEVFDVAGRIWSFVKELGAAFEPLMQAAIGAGIFLLDNVLKPIFGWIEKHREGVIGLAAVVGTLVVGIYAWSAITKIQAMWTGILATAQWALNVAMDANPIGLIILGFAALVTGIIYAWKHFETFRGSAMGLWATLKELGSIINDYLIQPLFSLGETLLGVFTFDPDMIAKGIRDGMKAAENIVNSASIGERLGGAFFTGFNNEVTKNAISPINQGYQANFIDTDKPTSIDEKLRRLRGEKKPASLGVNDKLSGKADTIGGVSGGGIKNQTITIQKLVENIIIHTTDNRQGISEMEEMIKEAVIRASNDFNYAK